jgi:hypothetical protein
MILSHVSNGIEIFPLFWKGKMKKIFIFIYFFYSIYRIFPINNNFIDNNELHNFSGAFYSSISCDMILTFCQIYLKFDKNILNFLGNFKRKVTLFSKTNKSQHIFINAS